MKLAAGTYWIGDPCYVLDREGFSWDKFCKFCFEGDRNGKDRLNEGVIEHQGFRFAFFGTEYGDGTYTDQFGNEYGVDAGILGCIPYDEAVKVGEEEMYHLGNVFEFYQPIECEYDNGKIIFGNIEINTGDDDSDDEEEDYLFDLDDDEYMDEDGKVHDMSKYPKW